MTTATSPTEALRAQSESIAAGLKAMERGAKGAEKTLTFGVIMDDKLIKVTMAWATIRETEQPALVEYILKQMQGASDAEH